MGSRVALDKCKFVSSSAWLRNAVKRHNFAGAGCLEVCTNMRDLGAHLSMRRKAVGPTIGKRLMEAKASAERLRTLRAPRHTRIGAICGKIIPMGIYGAASTAIPSKPMQALRTSISRVLDDRAATNRSLDLSLCTSFPKVVDPLSCVLVQRVVAL
eukprot:10047558-Alexandrium_andersonii.AAC.1